MIAVDVRHAEPRLAGTDLAVAEVVRACHATTIEDGLASLAVAGLDRSTLEPVLSYCAERRCEADNATCPGCRRGTDKLGIHTFDDFVAHHAWITFDTSDIRLPGKGNATLKAHSLESLARSWAGEEYWFWARRVIRKLRHGVRRAGQSGAPPPGQGATPALILVRPAGGQYRHDAGMANFSLVADLRLIEPRDGWPNEKARIAASGANFIIDGAQVFGDLKEALADLQWVCATSARQRDLVKAVLTPEQAVAQIYRRLVQGQRCGILFGPARNGVETEAVGNADALVMATINPNFASQPGPGQPAQQSYEG